MSGTVSLANVDQVDDSTTAAGVAEAAQVDLGNARTNVDLALDVSGAATITVEVSTTGQFNGEEVEAATVEPTEASTDFKQYHFAYRYVRAYADTNLNSLELVGRGL